jgi:alkylation response protein AidB-like acyl-CoA dehydrogenase
MPSYPSFGSNVPFAEPGWYRGVATAYYNESHVQLRKKVRDFVDRELLPNVDKWEEECTQNGKEVDFKGLTRKAYQAGILAPMYSQEIGGTPLPNNLEFDAFHDLIWIDELSRTGASGLIACLTIFTMALPPIIYHATSIIKEMVIKPVLQGEKCIALCITEASAGSDMANLATTAEKFSENGEVFYSISGQKKWITQAVNADFFTVAVRTSSNSTGAQGVSVILVERDRPGVTVRRMKLQGNWVAGTGVVTFDNVKVPIYNLLGKEGEGFKYIAHNLNHERLTIAVQAIRQSRLCIQDSIEFARVRKTFGKRLIDHQVVRHKIAEMARLTEASWSMAESLAYSLQNKTKMEEIAGPMALFKVMASKTFELCAREASQILGGASYTREGKGQRVERLYREVRSYAIPGGSEEILLDFAMRQSKL